MTHLLEIELSKAGIEFGRAVLGIRPVQYVDAPSWFIDRACRWAQLPAGLDTLPSALKRLERGQRIKLLGRNWGSSTCEAGRPVFVAEPRIVANPNRALELEAAADRIAGLLKVHWRVLDGLSWRDPTLCTRFEFTRCRRPGCKICERNQHQPDHFAKLRTDATGVIS